MLGRLEETALRLSFQENHPKLCSTVGLMRKLRLLPHYHSATVCCQDLSLTATFPTDISATSASGTQPDRPFQYLQTTWLCYHPHQQKECIMKSFLSHYTLFHQNLTQMHWLEERRPNACVLAADKGEREWVFCLLTWCERTILLMSAGCSKCTGYLKTRTNVHRHLSTEWLRLGMAGVFFR